MHLLLLSNFSLACVGANNKLNMADYQFAFSRNFVMTSAAGIGEITAICFDTSQELLWLSNSLGKIASFFGCGLDPYTSFTLSKSSARAIDVVGDVVLILAKDELFAFKRQGVLIYDYSNDNFQNLTCMCSLPLALNSFIFGGRQQKIIQMNLEVQKEQRLILLKDTDCLSMRATERYFYNTDSSGKLVMRNVDSMEVIHTVAAHDSGIYDFDVCGNKIITCGFTSKGNSPFCDPFLKVYDSRNLRGIAPISLHYSPIFCRFANSFSDGRVLVASKYGQLVSADLNGYQSNLLYQSCDSAKPTAINLSSSKQCAAIGDQRGGVSLFLDREDAVFNSESWPTTFASVEDCLSPLPIDNFNSNLACIPTPLPSLNSYCSDYWPESCFQRYFRKPRPIKPEFLQSTKSVQSVLYAKNPNANTTLRGLNVCPYEMYEDEPQMKKYEASDALILK